MEQQQELPGTRPMRHHVPHTEPNTPPDEAERVRADIEYQKHRERWREDRALALQWRYGDGQ